VRLESSRFQSQPWGLDGGGSAKGSTILLNGEVLTRGTVTLEPGDIVELQTPGGGGYGLPSARSPEMVRRDLAEGRITPAFARTHYGETA